MDVFETIEKRKSIRKYLKRPLDHETLLRLLKAIQLSPSARNRQPWQFIVVIDDDLKRKLAYAAMNQMFIADAGAIFVACGEKQRSGKWYLVDVAIACQQMILLATSLGLGTCWIGAFSAEAVEKLLEIPNDLETIALIAVGYTDQSPKRRHRKSIESFAHLNKYGTPFKEV